MWTEGIENRNGQRVQWTAASIDMLGRVLAHEKYHHAAMETFRAWKSEPNGTRKAQLRSNLDSQTRLDLPRFAAGGYYVAADEQSGNVITYSTVKPFNAKAAWEVNLYASDGRMIAQKRYGGWEDVAEVEAAQ